jgi:hypothetical protein
MRKRPTELKMEFIERCLSCEDKKMSTELCTDLWEKKQLAAIKRIRSFKKKDLLEFRKERTFVDSTNADRIMYDFETEILTIQFQDGGKYTYFDVGEETYNDIVDGNASTRTAGEWGPVGKSPSVGAAIHKYLINKGVKYEKGGSFR